jgi:hypothetical protein
MTLDKTKAFLRNGYNVIAVYRRGSEDQPVQAYTDKATGARILFTAEDADNWSRQHHQATALALTNGVNGVMSLDFDITSRKVAALMRRAVLGQYPNVLIRDCNAPKFTVLFRGGGDLLNASSGWSNWYSLEGDGNQVIEVNCCRKLTTVSGVHRKTGNLYKWSGARTPFNTLAASLPVIDQVGVGGLLRLFNESFAKQYPDALITRKMKLVPLNKSTVIEGEVNALMNPRQASKDAVQYTDKQVMYYIGQLDGNDREDWMQAGRALHHHYKAADVGLMLWDEYSKRFAQYDPDECEHQWGHMTRGGGTTAHTIATKVKRDKKSPVNLLEEFISRYVFIKKGSIVADKRMNTAESMLSLNDFRSSSLNQCIFKEGEMKADGTVGKGSSIPASKLWMADPERVSVYSTMFGPGQGRICVPEDNELNQEYWNTYINPNWEMLQNPNAHKLKYFTDHIEYLFGEEGPACVHWFYTWAAQMIQTPQIRGTVTLMHISTHTRTGRGWLSDLLRKLVGVINTSDTTITAMNNDGAKTGYMYNTILCTIAEVREQGKDRYSVSDSIKKKVTDTHLDIDVKYGDQALMKIYTRFFMQSNHADPLILDKEDKRFSIFANHRRPKSPKYYAGLYGVVGDVEFVNSVYTFLMNYKVDFKLLTTSMRTQARTDVIMASKSPTAAAYLEFMGLCDGYIRQQLIDFITQYHELHGNDAMYRVNTKELAHLEREYCDTSSTMVVRIGEGAMNMNVKLFDRVYMTDATDLVEATTSASADYFKRWEDKLKRDSTRRPIVTNLTHT